MFDEAAERAKLEVLDLTEDVIDMIIKKKRATYESKNAVVIPIVEPAPSSSEIPIPVLPEPTMERTIEPIVIVKRGLPWQRRK